jgi:hypothetical protein
MDHFAFEEFESLGDCPIICIPLCDIAMTSSEMGRHEADRRIVEVKSDTYSAFITAQAR